MRRYAVLVIALLTLSACVAETANVEDSESCEIGATMSAPELVEVDSGRDHRYAGFGYDVVVSDLNGDVVVGARWDTVDEENEGWPRGDGVRFVWWTEEQVAAIHASGRALAFAEELG